MTYIRPETHVSFDKDDYMMLKSPNTFVELPDWIPLSFEKLLELNDTAIKDHFLKIEEESRIDLRALLPQLYVGRFAIYSIQNIVKDSSTKEFRDLPPTLELAPDYITMIDMADRTGFNADIVDRRRASSLHHQGIWMSLSRQKRSKKRR